MAWVVLIIVVTAVIWLFQEGSTLSVLAAMSVIVVLGGWFYSRFRRAMWLYHRINEANDLLNKNQPEVALERYEEALTRADRANIKSIALLNMSMAHFQMGHRIEALRFVDEAIEITPNLALGYNNRAYYLATYGEAEEALDDIERALELIPKQELMRVYALNTRGYVYYCLGEYDAALQNFRAARNHPQSQTHDRAFHFALAGEALAYQAIGKLGEAKSLWSQLIEMDAVWYEAQTLRSRYQCMDAMIEAADRLIRAIKADSAVV